ncbi:hypothetical protein J1N35_026289 [Gossypium stocksii]|uniref:Uncharacterized protein n=1 Tax=Gossypium stocksii TaxID=47602 RepID=A0A9D3V920_9ROSI|nr:hypothetical protein J1N35_026289 [Gossypium stocksii]
MQSTINKENKLEPKEEKLYELGSMIVSFAKATMKHKQKGLMLVDINITG